MSSSQCKTKKPQRPQKPRDPQARFHAAVSAARSGGSPNLNGLTSKQLRVVLGSKAPVRRSPAIPRIIPQNLHPRRHHHYHDLFMRANMPPEVHPPKPVFGGNPGAIAYAYARENTSTTVFSIGPDSAAVIFFDRACQRLFAKIIGAGSFSSSTFVAGDDNITRDRHDMSALSGYLTAQPPSRGQFVESLHGMNGASTGNGYEMPDYQGVINNYPGKIQMVSGKIEVSTSIPWSGSATAYILAPNMSTHICGDNMGVTRSNSNGVAGGTEQNPDLANILRTPQHFVNDSYGRFVSIHGKVLLLRGASSTAALDTSIEMMPDYGWFVPGRRPFVANSLNTASNGGYPQNEDYFFSQGGMIVHNTSTSESVTVSMRARTIFAITQPPPGSITSQALLHSFFTSADKLDTNGAPTIGDRPTVQHGPSTGGTTPPAIHPPHSASHDKLEEDIRDGLAVAGTTSLASQIAKSGVGKSFLSKAGGVFSKALSFLGKEAVAGARGALPLIEGALPRLALL